MVNIFSCALDSYRIDLEKCLFKSFAQFFFKKKKKEFHELRMEYKHCILMTFIPTLPNPTQTHTPSLIPVKFCPLFIF